MAKKQYLISKEPRPMFPAFNPAIIETQASGFAVQQAEEIINSGVFPQGTNLLRYAKDDGSSYWEGFGAVITEKNGIIRGLSAGDVFPRIANPIGAYLTVLDMSSSYTLSFYVRGNKTENRLLLISDGGGQDHITPEQQYNIPITTYWTHYTLTFIPRIQINTTILLQIYTSIIWGSSTEDWTEIRDVKFEKGSTATDWTPSPYDIVATYDASNFNPLTIKVVPGKPNEDIPPVVVGVATGKEGKYKGDIANVAKRLFINITKDAPIHDPGIGTPITLTPKIDYNLRADLSVEDIGSYTALNAVRQFGGKLNLSKVFFAVNGSVVQYPGYPLSVALVNGDFDKEGENTLLIVAGDNLGITQEPHIVLDIPQGTEKLQAVNLSTEASDEVAITSGCIADNPFYVR